jgi:Ca-activated chloride channel family protein
LDLDRGGDLGGAEEAGQRASELEEQVAVVDRELSRARAELASGGQRVDGRQVAERVRWALRARAEATGPAALGLTPLASEEELLVIARDDRPVPGGQAGGPPCLAAVEGEGRGIPFPLRETAVRARVDAYIATVEVEQRYDNPYATKVEAVYIFPLPHDAAVDEFLMTIGKRRIRGIIREREQAEQIYLEARKKGHVASLLTQERPNVFTQRVANLEPGHSVDIQLTYYATLPYRDGGYELCIPAVVGPRFNPPGSVEGIAAAPRGPGGSTGQPSEVQYLKPGESSGHTMTLVVDLDAGVAVEELSSSSHQIQVETEGDSRRRISLAQGAVVPDRDFLLRWKVAGDQVKAAFLQHRDERGGYFTMVITPPSEEVSPPRPPAEHILVVDCSGSMQGAPLEQAKRAATRVLERLGPDDAFQVIRFSSQASALGSEPVAATPEAVRRGLDFVNSLDSGGGTMMVEGVKAAFDLPPSGRVRLVSLLTDGFISNEAEILAAVHSRLGSSRIFSFGVGTSPTAACGRRTATGWCRTSASSP